MREGSGSTVSISDQWLAQNPGPRGVLYRAILPGINRMEGLSVLSLGERPHEVPPQLHRRQPLDRPLPALGERDRLPLVIGASVPDQEIQQVHREEGIAARAPFL